MSLAIGRRGLLLGAAAGLSAFAGARPLRGEAPPGPAPRLVVILQNNGTQQRSFWPGASFTSPILAPLLDDPAIASRCRLVKRVFVPIDANGTDANEHDMGFARMLTGERLLSVGGKPFGGARSVDQIVARAFGEESLALAVLASEVEPFPKLGYDHRRSFSYVAPGVHKVPYVDMVQAFDRFFAPPAPLDAPTRRRLLARKSVLDTSLEGLARLRERVPPHEREKLERHADAVREVERGLVRDLEGRPGKGALSPHRPARPASVEPAALESREHRIPELVGTAMDLVGAAVASGAARVSTVQLGYGGGKWRFSWEGVDMDLHGECAHRDTSDEGSSPENTDRLVRANRWYASQVARLVKKLAAIPETADTSVLDHTLVVWVNEMGRGDHSLENVPVVLLGGSALPGLGPGGRVVDTGERQPFQRLGCTILRAMGQKADGFGDLPSCGPFAGLV
jgi:hypothetical protein